MRKVKVVTITKKDTDFGIEIPAGTTGVDVEVGLATAIIQVAQHNGIKPVVFLKALESWIVCITENQ